MSLSKENQYWLDRLQTEVAAISKPEESLVASMILAETQFAYFLDDGARETLVGCLDRFDLLEPGSWPHMVGCAADLCAGLSENQLLLPEVERGLGILAVPEKARCSSHMREEVHEVAIRAGRADVAAQLRSSRWPGKRVNRLVDACGLAGWAGDATGLQRGLPAARKAVAAAKPGPEYFRETIGERLLDVCVHAGLLAEGAELWEEFGLDDVKGLVIALSMSADRDLYVAVRDRWLATRIDAFRTGDKDLTFDSWHLKNCAETLQRLGDDATFQRVTRQFHELVSAWGPKGDDSGCDVYCHLGALFVKAGEAKLASEYLNRAKRLFDGVKGDKASTRKRRSIMADNLSTAYLEAGEFDLAMQYAQQITHSDDRRGSVLVSVLVLGGQVSAAERELAKQGSAKRRACTLSYALMTEYPYGFDPLLRIPQRQQSGRRAGVLHSRAKT